MDSEDFILQPMEDELAGYTSSSEYEWTPSKARRKLDFGTKPYKDQSFFFDLKTCTRLPELEKGVSDFGGRIERFLCKDVTCVVTDRRDWKRFVGPSNNTSILDFITKTKAQTPSAPKSRNMSVPSSRGQALLMKSAIRRPSVGSSDALTNAKSWGIKIKHVTEVLNEIRAYRKKFPDEKKFDSKSFIPLDNGNNVEFLIIPYIKIEDKTGKYRPDFKNFKSNPTVDCQISIGSPFVNRLYEHKEIESSKKPMAYDSKKASQHTKAKQDVAKQQGYCECCDTCYNDLNVHLSSRVHSEFANDDNNFKELDSVIKYVGSFKSFIQGCLEQEQRENDNVAMDPVVPTKQIVEQVYSDNAVDFRLQNSSKTEKFKDPYSLEAFSIKSTPRFNDYIADEIRQVDETPKILREKRLTDSIQSESESETKSENDSCIAFKPKRLSDIPEYEDDVFVDDDKTCLKIGSNKACIISSSSQSTQCRKSQSSIALDNENKTDSRSTWNVRPISCTKLKIVRSNPYDLSENHDNYNVSVKPLTKTPKQKPTSSQWSVTRSGGMKLKFCRVLLTPLQSADDTEQTMWRVKRSGDCRLIFSTEGKKKRKDVPVLSDRKNRQSKKRKLVL